MPNNPDELLRRVIAEARAIGIPVSDKIEPHVVLNRRAVGRFGLCIRRGGEFTIELSERLLAAPEFSCRQTLAHEVLHTCPGCENHQARWKKYAAQMNAAYGYRIERTGDCEALGVEQTRAANYRLVCTRCGAEINRQRKSAVVSHPERYRCTCGGRLMRVK